MIAGITKVYRANTRRLIADREICESDGIDCENCPVKEKCRKMWDSLQETTQIYKSGIPGRYVSTHIRWFAELRREKWEKYNQLVAARGGNHSGPTR